MFATLRSRLLPSALSVAGVAVSFASPAHSAALSIEVLDNGGLVGMSPLSRFGTAGFDGANSDFSSISVTANGPPTLPGGDLSSQTLDIRAAPAFTGTHTLTVDVFQTGINVGAGLGAESTFSVNNLIGVPGPATLSDYVNGTQTTLGTLLNTSTFAAGETVATDGPLLNVVGPAITADAEQYQITFTHPGQSASDTIQLTTGIPEPSTWAMTLLGFAVLGYLASRTRVRRARSESRSSANA